MTREHAEKQGPVTTGMEMTKTVEERERVVIRFVGGSGDGMQLAGPRFPDTTAM